MARGTAVHASTKDTLEKRCGRRGCEDVGNGRGCLVADFFPYSVYTGEGV